MTFERIAWDEAGTPTERALLQRLEAEGFEAFVWHDEPGADYQPHAHDHDESLWCVRGAITFRIAGSDYRLGPGDRLMLPRGTVHAAEAGADGATYLIGERS